MRDTLGPNGHQLPHRDRFAYIYDLSLGANPQFVVHTVYTRLDCEESSVRILHLSWRQVFVLLCCEDLSVAPEKLYKPVAPERGFRATGSGPATKQSSKGIRFVEAQTPGARDTKSYRKRYNAHTRRHSMRATATTCCSSIFEVATHFGPDLYCSFWSLTVAKFAYGRSHLFHGIRLRAFRLLTF